jgi:replicative DNA helicase
VSDMKDKQAGDALFLILRGLEALENRIGQLRDSVYIRRADEYSLPANANCETTILGAILLDNAAYAEVAAALGPDDWSLNSHRRIFLRMAELMDAKKDVDIVTLAELMAVNKEIECCGGVAYLAGLTEGLPRRPVIDNYISIVKEKAKLRTVIGACDAAIRTAEDQHVAAAEIVSQLGVALKGIKKSNGK